MWINICAIYFYLLYMDVNRLKFPDAWYLYNVLCINNFMYIYNYIPNIIIYIIKRNIIIKQIYSNIPKKRRRFLDPFNFRVKTRRKKGEERRSYVWEKGRNIVDGGGRMSQPSVAILKVSQGIWKRENGKRRHRRCSWMADAGANAS